MGRVKTGKARAAAMVLAASIAGLLWAVPPVLAQESAPQTSPRAVVTLVSDMATVAPGETFRLGLRQKLSPNWHTYWKNPGDAGSPPEIRLKLPTGVTAGEIVWPGPDRFASGPAMSYGYGNEIVFPITVMVPKDAAPGRTLSIAAEADWIVCEKECIPESGSFRLDVPIGAIAVRAGDDVSGAFALADERRPIASPWSARLTPDGDTLALTVEGPDLSAQAVKEAYFYPAAWGVTDHAAPQRLTVATGKLDLALTKGQGFNPQEPVGGLLAITDGSGQKRWFELNPRIGAAPAGGSPAGSPLKSMPLWRTALFAFLGGLILNLMPCVFPVLAIKATSIVNLSGGALREVRLASAFYTLGVLVAFAALAGALLAVRAGGNAVGWGFQFQSPLFVAAMSWLLLAIGLNLSGVFEIGMSVAGTGQSLAQKPGHSGSFFTGLLAVVVATPCTAPFMGAAIGSALTAPVYLCLLIFLTMGLGLAAPYALLGLFPGLARALPRPGLWMVRLRQAMAFPMYASAAWLVWVLSLQAGDFGVLVALAGAVLVGVAAWLYGIAQHGTGRGLVPRGLAAATTVGALALLAQLHGVATAETAQPSTASARHAANYETFTSGRLAALRKEGKAVFVNMTAAWCITCLVNERTTLSTGAVQAFFRDNGIVYLKGDWTNRNPEIGDFLRRFNRDGLPFYAFYPAGGREAVVLPPVLTEALLTGEIRRADNAPATPRGSTRSSAAAAIASRGLSGASLHSKRTRLPAVFRKPTRKATQLSIPERQ